MCSFVVASTNYLDRLDPGLTKRPSRFDRKYLFPLPTEHERTLYCQFWKEKLSSKRWIDFPEKLCPAMAHITSGFSFAFLQECFVATLLVMARGEMDFGEESNNSDLDEYKLWRTFKQQADLLRKEVQGQNRESAFLREQSDTPSHMIDQDAAESDVQRYRSAGGSGTLHPLLQDLKNLHAKENLFPSLPYVDLKKQWINTAAYEYR